jgi:peptidyl-prolyl cis-trans isomerase D
MLEAIRKRSAGIVVKGLLGLLILSFAMWGIADVFSPSGANQTLATVGDVEVQPDQVQREYNREIERLSTAFGTRLDPEQARMFGIGPAVVERVVERTLYDLGAKDLGILVTDDLVRESIRNYSGFKNANGEFERARFEQVLQSNRLSESGYVELTRGDLARAQFLSMLDASSLTPKRLANSLYAFRNEKRIADTVTFKYDAVTVVSDPDTATLSKFHEENAQSYTAAEYRRLTFISLTAEEIAREIAVSDDSIQQMYEDRLDEFSEPEKRDLQQIRFKDETAAKAAHDRLKTGDDFLKVALDLAQMDEAATKLGDMKKSELMPALADPAFSLEVDSYTGPLKSVLGWHILRLKGITAARQKALEEVSADLKKQIAAEKAIDSLYSLANRLEDELGGGSSLEEAALALNVPIKNQGDIDARGLTPADTGVSGLPGGKFLEVAFSTASGQESALTEAGDDGYFIVRVDSIVEPALKPLDSVRTNVIDDWKGLQRRELAQKSAEALISELKAGGALAKLAADKGLTVTTTKPVDRNGGGATLPRDLVGKLFEANLGETISGAGNDGFIIAVVKESIAANPVADADEVKKLSGELNNAIRGDLMNQLASGLQQRFPVTMNTEAINAQF